MVGNHPAVLDLRPIAGPDRAPYRHHIALLNHRPHDLLQRVILQHRVRVHADEIREFGGVDAHVQGVGLAAVFLTDQGDGHLVLLSLKDGEFRLTGNASVNGAVDLIQMKGFPQNLCGTVGGAVIHNDNLIEFVLQTEQGPDGGLNGNLLIVGGHHQSHRHVVVLQQLVFQLVPAPELVQGGGAHRHRQEQEAGISDHV